MILENKVSSLQNQLTEKDDEIKQLRMQLKCKHCFQGYMYNVISKIYLGSQGNLESQIIAGIKAFMAIHQENEPQEKRPRLDLTES